MSGAPKQAQVYFRRDGKQVIVVALHTTRDGRLLEEAGPLSLRTWDDETLGESVLTALDRCATVPKDRSEFSFGKEGLLKVAGEPSLRAFDSSFVRVDVHDVAGERPGLLIQGIPESDLTIGTTSGRQAPPAELGRHVTRIYAACRDRRF